MDLDRERPAIDGLDQLGVELARAAEADKSRARSSWLRRRGLLIGVLALLLIPTGSYAIAQIAKHDGLIPPPVAEQRLTLKRLEQLHLTRGGDGQRTYKHEHVMATPHVFAPLSERPRALEQVKCSAVNRAAAVIGGMAAIDALKAQCIRLHRANQR